MRAYLSRTSAPTPVLIRAANGFQIILGKVRPITSPGREPSTSSDHCSWGRDGLLFPVPIVRGHLDYGSFHATWDAARRAAGRPDLRLHNLWDTGAVLAAQTGATLAELMSRLGQSSPAMAIRYQHAALERDRTIAEALSRMAPASWTKDLKFSGKAHQRVRPSAAQVVGKFHLSTSQAGHHGASGQN